MAAESDKKSTIKKLSDKALSKNAKISQAQQYTLLVVLGTGILLGVAIATAKHFASQIDHNAKVIAAADQSIDGFSEAIKNAGICPSPSNGKIYNDDEIKKCNPDSVKIYDVPDTLRSNILQNVAANEALNSVPKEEKTNGGDQESSSEKKEPKCINEETGKQYTYDEMQEIYNSADTSDGRTAATELIQKCSALRVIPDALPENLNEPALLGGLEKIFDISNWKHESLKPTGISDASDFSPNLQSISLQFSIDSSYSTAMTVLKNMERSIREFNVLRASIEWSGENSMELNVQANSFFITTSVYSSSTTTIPGGSK